MKFRKKKSRKGFVQADFVAIIIILVALVLLFFLLRKIFVSADLTTEEMKCRESIGKYIVAKTLTKGDFNTQIECPTWFDTITEKNEYTIKKEVAEKMRRCWSIWYEGKNELFKEDYLYCHPCYIIDFKEKDKKISGMNLFLAEETIPYSNLSYMDYLAGFSTPNIKSYYDENINQIEQDKAFVIDTNKQYAVFFVYAKGEDAIDNIKNKLGGDFPSAGIAAGIGGTGGFLFAVFVIGASATGPIAVILIGAGAIISGAIAYFSGEPPQWMSLIALREYNVDKLKDIGCEVSPASNPTD